MAALLCLAAPRVSAQQEVSPPPAASAPSTIYFAKEADALDQFQERPAVTRRMVDQLVMAATRQPDIARAWRSLVTPSDRVGIKVAAAGGQYFASHRGIVEAIVEGLEASGIPRTRIIVWDRDAAELEAAGYTSQRRGYEVRGIAPAFGYDRTAPVTAQVLGRLIWGDALFQEKQKRFGRISFEADQFSSTSYFATILTRAVTKVINVPVLSDEAGCGVAGALYNLTVPNVDNWRRFAQQDGAAAIPELFADDHVRPKVIIHIMDALLAQYAGGPHFNPNYAFAWNTIYASKDPVALDANASRLIDKWRVEAKLPPITRRTEWLADAEQMGLGNFAESKITLQQVGPK